MKQVLCVYRRELLGYFNTPIAYIFIPLFVGLMASFFFWLGNPYFIAGQAELRSLFAIMPIALFLFVPAVTMKTWSEELRVGTAEILLTLPYRVWQLVIGKFLAAYTIVGLSLLLTVGLAVAVEYSGNPDWGPMIGGYLGSLLMAGMFVAIGTFVSSLTRNQVVALLIGLVFGVLIVFAPDRLSIFFASKSPGLGLFLKGLGVSSHFLNFEKGVITLADTLYFVTVAGFFLTLNVFRIESRRY